MKKNQSSFDLGANLLSDGTCRFRVWAPRQQQLTLRLHSAEKSADAGARTTEDLVMERSGDYFTLETEAAPGDLYSLVVANEGGALAVPDPVSRQLPEGVHGPTAIIDPLEFSWSDDAWRGIPLEKLIIYELHTGTFTPEGTFDGAIAKLEYLAHLGITAIELMPVAAFPRDCNGKARNWGYDGVSPYAVETSYGGPEALRRLVNAAHQVGIAVLLDVVYNHLGNEGNYTGFFGPYFTSKHSTPWGDAMNYDAPGCEGVREWVLQNALYWICEYHLDGLRLDAVHSIFDDSPRSILAQINDELHALGETLGRPIVVIAETDENDSRVVTPTRERGLGFDAFWSDDFHHSFHALLTGEREGYYQDFSSPEDIVRALNDGYVFQGQPFAFWNKPRGTPAKDVPLPANVICLQNHDQVGNRALGERLTHLCSWSQRRAAAAFLLLAPHTPMLFMGEEYDETAPFLFFTSYCDPKIIEAVRNGRREEFRDFTQFNSAEVPDPQDESTFLRSKLDWESATPDSEMLGWYAALIGLRKRFVEGGPRRCRAELHNGEITMEVPADAPQIRVLASLQAPVEFEDESGWQRVLSAQDEKCSVAIYTRQ